MPEKAKRKRQSRSFRAILRRGDTWLDDLAFEGIIAGTVQLLIALLLVFVISDDAELNGFVLFIALPGFFFLVYLNMFSYMVIGQLYKKILVFALNRWISLVQGHTGYRRFSRGVFAVIIFLWVIMLTHLVFDDVTQHVLSASFLPLWVFFSGIVMFWRLVHLNQRFIHHYAGK